MRFSKLARLLPGLLLAALSAHGQLLPDGSFQPQEIYQPATVHTARQFADGSRVLAGTFIRTSGGTPVPRVARYLPNGTLDAAFNTNVANNIWNPNIIEEFPGGKILVSNSGGSMTISGQTRNGLARLNPDGTLDLAYQASVLLDTFGYLDGLLIQPDGKVVFSGYFESVNGQPAHNIGRLNADGTLDAAFMAAAAAIGFDDEVYALVRQPDGKLLAGGFFTTFNGQTHPALVRLNSNGTLDPSFDLQVPATTYATVQALAVQPDGKIVLSGSLPSGTGTISFKRVQASGADDPSFTPDPSSAPYNFNNTNLIQVQADGKIVLINPSLQYNGQPTSYIIRLLATGAFDYSFQSPAANYSTSQPSSVQLLSGGQLLIAGGPGPYAGRTATPTGIAVLNSDGSYAPGFAPVLQNGGQVSDFVLQPDGKMVLGGVFTEINGTAVSNLARLNADGTLDVTYSTNALTLGGGVNKMLLLPDGKVMAGGSFSIAGGATHPGVVRLLTSGSADATFNPDLQPSSTSYNPVVTNLGVQPSGKVVLTGTFQLPGIFSNIVRVTATGQPDATFQATGQSPSAMLVQPDGRILAGGYYRPANATYYLRRLLVDGALDPAFVLTPVTASTSITTLALLPDSRILVGGRFSQFGSTPTAGIARLQANGTPDASFTSGLPTTNPQTVRVLAVQPNQRILAAVNATMIYTTRLLPNGGQDVTYAASQGPNGLVNQIRIQPDGKLLMGGSFIRVSGQPYFAFTRLTDPNVLSVNSRQDAARLEAYPNPVHEQLTLRLDAAARPQRITLVSLTGRTVRQQPVTSAEQQLSVRDLAPGVYLLRVDYATGPVTRRIVVE
jgi:uncharacterized delta-60 repeat protein